MNFTISKSELYNALHKVVGVVPQKTTISILTCILLELEEQKLRLTGTDLEISVSLTIPVNTTTDGAGSVAVPGRLLLDIVRELPDVPLNISSDVGGKIVIKTEKGEYKIASQPEEDFPKITVEEGEYNFKVAADLLAHMINSTIFAVSTDELRPALTGVNMTVLPNEFSLVGTDGHRLVRYVAKSLTLQENMQLAMIIPTKALNLLLRNLDDKQEIAIHAGEDHVVFALGNSIIYSKLINGTYPNYERVIPTDNDKRLRLNRELFISTLRRVSIFSSSLTNQIRLIITPQEMTIHSEDIEFGAEAKESIPVTFTNDWMQIGYNSVYLLEILRHVESEQVVFELKDTMSAALVYPSEQKPDRDVLMLLMPIRLNEEVETSETEEPTDEVADFE